MSEIDHLDTEPLTLPDAPSKTERVSIPVLEVPHFFLNPGNYVSGFEPSTAKFVRNGDQEVTKGIWYGVRNVEGYSQPVDLIIKSPKFIANALARAKNQQPAYKVKVKPRF